jgi:hypothetical protein
VSQHFSPCFFQGDISVLVRAKNLQKYCRDGLPNFNGQAARVSLQKRAVQFLPSTQTRALWALACDVKRMNWHEFDANVVKAILITAKSRQ